MGDLQHSKLWYSKLWDAHTLDAKNLIVEVDRVAEMSPEQTNLMYEVLNRYGVAILQHSPPADGGDIVEELHRVGTYFGSPVKHDRSDDRGLVVVGELSGLDEFVGASSGPHLMHTGGTFMPWAEVPRIVLLQCEVSSPVGGRSMVSSGAAAVRHLKRHDPESLALLSDPDAFAIYRSARGVGEFGGTGGIRKAVFDHERLGEGRIWLTFRFDGQVKLDLRPEEAHEAFDKLLNFFNRSENQVDFKLKPNQILICDNTSVVHARTAYQTGSGRKLNRLQLNGDNDRLVFGFPQAD